MGWILRVETDAGARYKAGHRGPDRRVRYKTFARERDARAYLAQVESEKVRGSYVDPAQGRVTFAEFFEHFMATATSLRPSTRSLYAGHGRLYLVPAFGHRRLDSITQADVRRFAAELSERKGRRTVEASYALLRRVLQIAMEERRIAWNPALGVKVPHHKRTDQRFLQAAEIAAIASEVPERYRALVDLLGYGGLRIGEAVALRVKNLDLMRGRVHVLEAAVEVDGCRIVGETKTGKGRAVLLPRFVGEELAEHLERFAAPRDPESLVFTTETGAPIRQTNFRNRIFYPACRRAGVEPIPHVHDLRHSAVALAIAAGAHPQAIKEMAGHSSITTTFNVYGHLFDTLQERTVEELDRIHRAALSVGEATIIALPREEPGPRP